MRHRCGRCRRADPSSRVSRSTRKDRRALPRGTPPPSPANIGIRDDHGRSGQVHRSAALPASVPPSSRTEKRRSVSSSTPEASRIGGPARRGGSRPPTATSAARSRPPPPVPRARRNRRREAWPPASARRPSAACRPAPRGPEPQHGIELGPGHMRVERDGQTLRTGLDQPIGKEPQIAVENRRLRKLDPQLRRKRQAQVECGALDAARRVEKRAGLRLDPAEAELADEGGRRRPRRHGPRR
jgi:hypothetical protein